MEMRRRIKLKQFAELNGISYQTALKMFQQGQIVGIQLEGGTILVEGFKQELEQALAPAPKMKALTYARVAATKHKKLLQGITAELSSFAESQGLDVVATIEEIAPAYSDSRVKLMQILDRDDWDWLIVQSTGSLMKFGAPYLETLLAKSNRHILAFNESGSVDSERSHDMPSAEAVLNNLLAKSNDMASQLLGYGPHKRAIQEATKTLLD